jgi:hypothetical protein
MDTDKGIKAPEVDLFGEVDQSFRKEMEQKKILKKKFQNQKILEIRDQSKISVEERDFNNAIEQVKIYLSWGRSLDSGFFLADIKLQFVNRASKTSHIECRLPLFEEILGTLTEQDLIYPGRKDLEWGTLAQCCEHYGHCVSNVLDYLEEIFPNVTITNNIITIKEQFEREAWDILTWQELEYELHHTFYDY